MQVLCNNCEESRAEGHVMVKFFAGHPIVAFQSSATERIRINKQRDVRMETVKKGVTSSFIQPREDANKYVLIGLFAEDDHDHSSDGEYVVGFPIDQVHENSHEHPSINPEPANQIGETHKT